MVTRDEHEGVMVPIILVKLEHYLAVEVFIEEPVAKAIAGKKPDVSGKELAQGTFTLNGILLGDALKLGPAVFNRLVRLIVEYPGATSHQYLQPSHH